jgi:ABC-type phosphate transport system permease subunit
MIVDMSPLTILIIVLTIAIIIVIIININSSGNTGKTLQEEVREKTDRELQMDLAYFAKLNEGHLRSIRGSLNWILIIIIIGMCISGFVAISAANAVNRY